jgi:hypothetical protein
LQELSRRLTTAMQEAHGKSVTGMKANSPSHFSLTVTLHVTLCYFLQELSRRLTTAMQEAHGKSVTGMKAKMQDLAKSLGLPNPAALTGGGM